MELTDDKSKEPFLSVMDDYERSFHTRDIELFRSLHVTDGRVVFFDNHPHCDSNSYGEHEIKVADFFRNGQVMDLMREDVRVFEEGGMACVTARIRYSTAPYPGVRTTYVMEREDGGWKIRHMHHSFDPNEYTEA